MLFLFTQDASLNFRRRRRYRRRPLFAVVVVTVVAPFSPREMKMVLRNTTQGRGRRLSSAAAAAADGNESVFQLRLLSTPSALGRMIRAPRIMEVRTEGRRDDEG